MLRSFLLTLALGAVVLCPNIAGAVVTVEGSVPIYPGDFFEQLDPSLGIPIQLDLFVSGSKDELYGGYGSAPQVGEQPAIGQFNFGAVTVGLSGFTNISDYPFGGLEVASYGIGELTIFDPSILASFVGLDILNISYDISPLQGGYESPNFLQPGGTGHYLATFTYAEDVAPSVPEPASWALMLAGMAGVGAALRQKRKRIFSHAPAMSFRIGSNG